MKISLLQRLAANGLSRAMSALFVLVMLSGAAMAQETGQINGTITDPNDALVPSATVVVKSVGTGTERTAATGSEATYLVTNLQPGLYDVTVTAAGFAPTTQRAQVSVGGKLTLNITLSVGATPTETVDVIAGGGGVEVNTTDQQLSSVVTNTQIRELPTLTRNPYDLVGLSGNVAAENGGGRGTGFAINGLRSASTSILLDGAENVDTFRATVGQSVPLDSVQEFRVITGNFSAEYGRASGGIVNVATIAGSNEFHGTLYEFNRISRLASNGFNNNSLGNNPDGTEISPRQVFTRNQYGYSIGGPFYLPRFGEGAPSIYRDTKLFFFNNTEWIKVRSGGTRSAFVPTAQFLAASSPQTQAFFAPYQVGGTVGSTLTAAQVVALVGTFRQTPNAPVNAFTTLAAVNPNLPVFQRVTYSTPRNVGGGTPEDEYQTVIRVDYNKSDKTQFYVRYALQSQVFAQGTTAFSPYAGFSTGNFNFNQNILLTLTHSFSSNLVSQTKLGFNRLNGGSPLGAQPNVPTLYFNASRTTSLQGFPIALPGYLPFSPGSAIPFAGAQNLYQLTQDVTYTTGKHTFRLGGQIVHIRDNKTFGAYANSVEVLGNTTGEALSNFITGNLISFSVAINPGNRFPGDLIPLPVGPPSFSRSNRYTELAGYVNDSWRISPRVNINLGLRYEYYGVQHNAQDPALDANFYYGDGATFAERIRNARYRTVPQSGIGGLWRPDKNNFAPRVGIAWDVFGDGTTSLRGGYGLAYERNFGNVTFNVLFNPPNYGVVALTANSCSTAACTGAGFTAGDVPNLPVNISNFGPFSGTGPARLFTPTSARAVDQNITNAYAHFWSASFQRQLSSGTVAALEYSGSAGRDLYSISDLNRLGGAAYFGLPAITNVVGRPTSRLNPESTSVNSRRNDGYSNYQALIASLESNNFRNMGPSFTARYTLATSKDNLSSTFGDTNQPFFLGFTNTFDPKADYGYSDNDTRHRLAIGFNYEVPFKGDNAFTRNVLGGWSINSTVEVRSGYPFTIYDCSFQAPGGPCARLIPSGALNINTNNPPDAGSSNSFVLADLSGFRYAADVPDPANPGMFLFRAGQVINPALPDPRVGNYNFGSISADQSKRNAFRGPGFWNVDMGVHKRFRISEKFNLQLRAEVFNLFNHANLFVNYDSPDVSGGNVLGLRDGRRNVQLAAKIIF